MNNQYLSVSIGKEGFSVFNWSQKKKKKSEQEVWNGWVNPETVQVTVEVLDTHQVHRESERLGHWAPIFGAACLFIATHGSLGGAAREATGSLLHRWVSFTTSCSVFTAVTQWTAASLCSSVKINVHGKESYTIEAGAGWGTLSAKLQLSGASPSEIWLQNFGQTTSNFLMTQ